MAAFFMPRFANEAEVSSVVGVQPCDKNQVVITTPSAAFLTTVRCF
jgi:hypothetical protein